MYVVICIVPGSTMQEHFHISMADRTALCPPQVWDLRKDDVLYTLSGHNDTVTGISVSPDGSYLLSNAMDNTGE